jgi:thiamine-phosphate pyrophosphorylase
VTQWSFAVYLVTDTAICGGADGVSRTVVEALDGGVTAVQVRDPLASTRDLVALALALRTATRAAGVPLIINDRVDVALAVDADGAHVGQSDLDPIRARALLGPDKHLGLSISSEAELEAALALPAGTVDLLGVGPIRPTPSKPDAAPAMGWGGLARVCGGTALPCVAIGGIGLADVAEVARAGAVGMAVISAVCGQSDPRSAAAKLAAAWSRARTAA